MTKINVTVDIDFKGIVEDARYDNITAYSLEEEVLNSVKYELSQKIVSNIVEKNLISYDKEEDIKKLKEVYKSKISELNEKIKQAESTMETKVKEVLENMIKGTFVRTNSWGEIVEETTVENVIKEKLFELVKSKSNIENTVEKMASKIIDDTLKLKEYDLKIMVNKYKDEVMKENTKKVTEFLINGLK